MLVRYLALAAGLLFGAHAAMAQQSAADHIALGDKAHADLNPADALAHYEAAIKADSTNYEALWKAARDAVDLAEFDTNKDQASELFRRAQGYAQRAVAANPNDAEGHFTLARAIGRVALTLGKRDRVKYAGDVRTQALEALKINPDHPGALHVMGRWNAEVMRLDGFSRFMAKNFLGGKVFNSASWADAQKYMERAVAVDPTRLTHHLDLAEVYRDLGQKDKAREQFELVIKGESADYNDPHYKQQAEQALAALNK